MTEDIAARGPSATRRAAIGGAGAIGASLLLARATLAQESTPTTDPAFGLASWAEQLSSLDPAEIGTMLLELAPAPHDTVGPLVTEDLTDLLVGGAGAIDVERVASVVGIGTTETSSGEFAVDTGSFFVFDDAGAARDALNALPAPGEVGALSPTTVAGLPGLWGVWDEDYAELFFVAGPVLVLVTDSLFAAEARTHVAVAVWSALANAQYLLRHLFLATRDALAVG